MVEFTLWDILRNLLLAARWTIMLSAVAFAGGAAVGLAILLLRISKKQWARRFASGYISLFQGTPLLMQLFLMFFGLPMLGFRIEPWTAAVLGLTFFASAYLAEIWRGCVAAIPRGQWEAAQSLALNFGEQLRHVVLPQAVRRVVPPLMNDLVSLQKDSGLIAVLGVIDAIRAAQIETALDFNFTPYVVAGALFVALTIPMARFTDHLARKQGMHGATGSL